MNIDHRTKESNFEYQKNHPLMPSLGCNLRDLDKYENIILVGVNIKTEYPVLIDKIKFSYKKQNKSLFFYF